MRKYHFMSFKEKLSLELKGRMDEKELKLLPAGCRFIGSVIILKLPPALLKRKKIICSEVLKFFPYMKTACIEEKIFGSRRQPKIEVIAGARKTETILTEHGCRLIMDPAKVMFSVGNKFEKERLLKICKPNETVVDMFAGIGYWTVPIAEFCRPKKIFAIDKNKIAVEYLEKNCKLNKVSGKVEILQGDCRKFSHILESKADRIIMGWIFETEKFLPFALRIAKKKCTIHFHRILHPSDLPALKKRILLIAKKQKCKIKFSAVRQVKTYSPRQRHFVLDIIALKS